MDHRINNSRIGNGHEPIHKNSVYNLKSCFGIKNGTFPKPLLFSKSENKVNIVKFNDQVKPYSSNIAKKSVILNSNQETDKNRSPTIQIEGPFINPRSTSLATSSLANGVSSQVPKGPPRNSCRKMSQLIKRKPIDIDFEDLTYCVENTKNKGFKTILKGTSGSFRSGELTAVMGPSGAGKSTLMNILAGYRSEGVSGQININGKHRNLKSFRKISCYIMQDDNLLPFLTVREYMVGASHLKLGDSYSQTNKNIMINEILGTLQLSDCLETRVSSLSGGEKKRLSIALEMINNPPIMFLDEPTSGLDSQNSYCCISLLKSLAEEGRTIICTIHQPSAKLFEKFDSLYALANGQCIYKGSVPNLVPFLSSLALECPPYHNPADFLVEVASGEYGNVVQKLVAAANCVEYPNHNANKRYSEPHINLDLVDNSSKNYYDTNNGKLAVNENCLYPKFDPSSDSSPEHRFLPKVTEDAADYPASYWTQFKVLYKRTFLSIIRDTMLTKLRLAAHIVVGAFMAILYYNVGNEASKVLSNTGSLFFNALFLVFTAMMPTILTFPLEMNIFLREHLNHWYSLKSYYLAKTMADIPFQIVFPFIYVLIVYFLTDQPPEFGRFALYTSFAILTSIVAQSIGLAIGAAMDVQQAVFFGPAVAIPALLFSGFFVTYSATPVYLRWLTYLSYIRYGYEGSLLALFGGDRMKLECSEDFCMFKEPKKILEHLGVNPSYLWMDFSLLVIYIVFMRILGYVILRWKIRKER